MKTKDLAHVPALLAVRWDSATRPKPPATEALASDTGLGWYMEASARRQERGHDAEMSQYTLYAVDQRDYTRLT
ncbi:hypothetical protein [Nonomuraea sp. CA-141351]|uniref:hypothetical protein n=1 Tax=Nonomuraea sp. CA-141351 TaxID=3239996 RepID=UPI003D8A31B5